MTELELRHLRYFVAVAEELHFGRAAERLHMAQPPLSQQIKQLEALLGVTLFERTTRRVELTPAGTLMLDRARAILVDLEKLASDVRLVGEGASGVIRIGVVGSAAYWMMPRIVSVARAEMPGLRIHVTGELLTPALVSALERGTIDVAVLRPPVASDELEVKIIDRDEVIVALPATHPLAGREQVTLADLAGTPFIAFQRGSTMRAIAEEAARRSGFALRIMQEASETSTLLACVAAGLGVGFVPKSSSLLSLHGVVFVPLDGSLDVELALAWRSEEHSSPVIQRFVGLLEGLHAPEVAD